MESYITLTELFFLCLYLGAITFVIGTALFTFLLWNKHIKLGRIILYILLHLILSIIITLFIFILCDINMMIGFLFIPSCIAEVLAYLFFIPIIRRV